MKKYLTLGHLIGVLLIALIALVIVIYSLPIKLSSVKSITTSGLEFTAGDKFTYIVDRCVNYDTDIRGTVQRYLVTDNIQPIQLNTTQVTSLKRGCGKVQQTLLLPDNIPTGYYRLKIVSEYEIRLPFHSPVITEYSSDNSFLIKEKA